MEDFEYKDAMPDYYYLALLNEDGEIETADKTKVSASVKYSFITHF